MKKTVFLASLYALALVANLRLCAQTIDQGPQIGINEGATPTLTCTGCGTGLTWSVTGQGTIDSSTGVYTAPAHVTVQHPDRGCNVSSNNSVFNVPVDSLPVDSHSAYWLARVGQDPYGLNTVKLQFGEPLVFFVNPVTNSTPQQLMHFYYPSACQDCNFPWPSIRTAFVENGVYLCATGHYCADTHFLTENNQTCQQSEIYRPFPGYITFSFTAGNPARVSWTGNNVWPIANGSHLYVTNATGTWAGLNNTSGDGWTITTDGQPGTTTGTINFNCSGCSPSPYSGATVGSILEDSGPSQNANAQGGWFYSPTSYALLGGTDAAGMSLNALSIGSQEMLAAVKQCSSSSCAGVYLGHSMRFSIGTGDASARNLWPASSFASGAIAGFTNGLTNMVANGTSSTTVTVQSQIGTYSYPCTGFSYSAGCTFHVHIQGIRNGWSGANGDWVATAVDQNNATIPLNSSTFGTYSTSGQLNVCTSNPAGPCFIFDVMPYGATARIQAAQTFLGNFPSCNGNPLPLGCKTAWVWFNTGQKYGLVMADTTAPSANFFINVTDSELSVPELTMGGNLVKAAFTNFQNVIEIVNRTSQQISGYTLAAGNLNYQATNVNRTTVSVTGSLGTATADILLQGGVIGTDNEAFTQVASSTFCPNVWENGNASPALHFAIDGGISGSSINATTGCVAMPACSSKAQGTVTVSDTNDASIPHLYIQATCLPVNSDGGYRMALGIANGSDYTDTTGFTWWANFYSTGCQNGSGLNYFGPGWYYASACGSINQGGQTWATTGGPNYPLFGNSLNANNDIKTRLVGLTPGAYTVYLLGEPGYLTTGANQNLYDVQCNGAILATLQDGYVLPGNQLYHGYTSSFTCTVGSDGVLDFVGRARIQSTEGMSWSALRIMPSSGPPPVQITTVRCPDGTVNVVYAGCTLTATGGTPPYTYTYTGMLPPGLLLNGGTGAIAGTPILAGTYNPAFTATDSLTHSSSPATIPFNIGEPAITVMCISPLTNCTSGSLANLTVGVPADVIFGAVGGIPPYTFRTTFCFGIPCTPGPPPTIAGVNMSLAGAYLGTPTRAGSASLTVQACDSTGLACGPLLNRVTVAPSGAQGGFRGEFRGQMR